MRLRTVLLGLVAWMGCRNDATPVMPESPVPVANAPVEPPPPAAAAIDPRIEQVRAAFAAVALATGSDRLRVVICDGDAWTEGHLPRPADRRHAKISQTFVLVGASGRIEMHERAEIDGTIATTNAIIHADRIAVDEGSGSIPLDSNSAARWRTKLASAFPVRAIDERLLRSHAGPHLEAGTGRRYFFAASEAPPWEVFVGERNVALAFTTRDPLHGDLVEEFVWSKTSDALRIDRRRGGELVEQLTCRASTDGKEVARIEVQLVPEPAGPPPADVQVTDIAAGVHAVEFRHLDHRSLVVEHDGGLTVIEAPVDAATGELLLATIAERWPGIAIHRLVITHHHPDHAGGVRPFVARDTPIVTTPGNADYLHDIATASWASAPDALWLAPRPLRLELVTKRRKFGGIEVFDIGPDTGHTAEYLVVWIAGARVLVHGDLVAMREGEAVQPAGPRARGLYAALGRLRLKPTTLVGTWPVHGVTRTITAAQLRASVKRKP